MKKIKETQTKQLKRQTASQSTIDKAQLAKQFIEWKYTKFFKLESEKWKEQELFRNIIQTMGLSDWQKEQFQKEIDQIETHMLRKLRIKESILDYNPVAIIGRGAFGEVWLCRHSSGELVAVKKMSKKVMDKKNQMNHIRAEWDILAHADSNWIVELKSSFTDQNNLYLVMEYLPGGDLMNMLMQKDVFSEQMTWFYMAEAILAVESVHKLNFIHRDLKPDNILIDKTGHLKLTDFGLCKPFKVGTNVQGDELLDQENRTSSSSDKRERVYSMVGTIDYIAPEVFTKDGYTETVDWWSLGTIMFEMLMGYPPFSGKDPNMTCKQVMQFEKYFEIPSDYEISPEARDLLIRLISRPEVRLGRNGAQEIKNHPFFKGIDWDNIRQQPAVEVPFIENEEDTRNFDNFEEQDQWHDEYRASKGAQRRRQRDYYLIGYTYKRRNQNQLINEVKGILEKV